MQFESKQRQAAMRAFIRANDITLSRWEKAAGLSEGTVRNFLKRERGTMTDRTYEKLASAASDLLGRPIHAEDLRGTGQSAAASPDNILSLRQPNARSDIAESLPALIMYRSAPSGATGGNTLIFQQKVGEVERLRKFQFAHKAFCIEATDDLMSPFARARDTVIVDPEKIPRKGDECLFVRDPDAEPKVTMLRHLVEIKPSHWIVCEHNGRKTPYELPFAEWPACWPVVGVIRP